jgi:hypothetical protein
VFIGAVAFAAVRLALLVIALWREYGREFRIDVGLWREQLAYALPFALAVGIEVIQQNYHQYVVASRFDAATFAIYAVGCLQVPLVDMIMTSTVNVMMVGMAEDASHGRATVALWHETICRLAFLMVPLSIFLFVIARDLIVTLYTSTYAASVPIFMVWALTFLPSIFAVNAVLRVFAETRFLLVMNLIRLAMVAALIGWFLSTFGMSGAVLVTLVSTLLVTIVGVARIAHLLQLSFADALPWGRPGGNLRVRGGRRAAGGLDHARIRTAADHRGRPEQCLVRCGLFRIELLDSPPEGRPHRRSPPDSGWYSAAPASGLDHRWGPALAGPEGETVVCGIAGIVRWDGQPVREDEIRAMCGVMAHRGPDDEGVYIGDGVAIGMRRLSIIDLSNGFQPISNEDGSVWIVFNGEIYNYQELRRDLQRRGHVFKTASDTETIVHLYEDLGPHCVDRLRGMFAFAIWDTRRRRILLARDRLGIKPLYYYERDGELLFASELKPICSSRKSSDRSTGNRSAIYSRRSQHPRHASIVKGVSKLEPARVGVPATGRNLRIERYWDLDFRPTSARPRTSSSNSSGSSSPKP